MSDSEIICITGGTQGLGLAMVEGFIQRGARIASCGRSGEKLAELRKTYGNDHLFIEADLRKESDIKNFASSVFSTLGIPDRLINNAAIMNRNAPLWEISEKEFSQIVDINIKGVAAMIRHFAPKMITRGSGVIVNFSSGWGRSTSPEVAPYCTTKWAIEGLSAALSQELPSGLASIALNPGVINTPMLRSCFGLEAEEYRTAEEWAKTAVPFIESLGASHNGQALTAP